MNGVREGAGGVRVRVAYLTVLLARATEPCTNAQADCFLDFYKCQDTACIAGACVRTNVPNGKSCADMRNATNWDYCSAGYCTGALFNSTWVKFTTESILGNVDQDPAYAPGLQLR